MSTLRLLFVCSGNICRSPMAAGLARTYLDDRGHDAVVVSCGTLGIVGTPAAQLGQVAMEEIGIDISDHYSQGVQGAMLEAADWIVIMAPNHEAFLMRRFPHVSDRIVRMWEFASEEMQGISDPVGGNLAAFRNCRDLLQACVENWLDGLLPQSQH